MICSKEQLEGIVNKSLSFKPLTEIPAILAYTSNSSGFNEGEREFFQIFDKKDNPIIVDDKPLVLYRGECHGENRIKGLYHRGVNILFLKDGEAYVSTRTLDKDTYPGYTEFSASEHSKFGEDYLTAAVRGCMEELKQKVSPKQLMPFLHTKFDNETQSEQVTYYLLRHDGSEIKPDTTEIAKGEWVDLAYLKNTLKEDESMAKLHFRDDHLPALKYFLRCYDGG